MPIFWDKSDLAELEGSGQLAIARALDSQTRADFHVLLAAITKVGRVAKGQLVVVLKPKIQPSYAHRRDFVYARACLRARICMVHGQPRGMVHGQPREVVHCMQHNRGPIHLRSLSPTCTSVL